MSQPIQLTLSSWAEQNLSAILQAKNENDFQTAFSAFIGPTTRTVLITYNGEVITPDQYMKKLGFSTKTSVNYANSVEAAQLGTQLKDPETSGVVGMFFTTTRSDPPNTMETTKTNSVNLTIRSDALPIGPVKPGQHLDFRRVYAVNHVEAPISLTPLVAVSV